MNIPLPRAQVEWLEAQVASGRFASLEEAIASAVARLQVEEAADDAWTRAFIEEAIEALDKGEGTPWRKGEVLEKIKRRRVSDE
jgi:Arc/MetJ-type ribon-helix-helix transcriptional regulator